MMPASRPQGPTTLEGFRHTMYSIANASLSVSILHPIADQGRLGTRYCTGGYIFQVEDCQRGPLMAGPTYPDRYDPFNGQGIPDAFNLAPLRSPAGGAQALILGIGVCDLERNQVVEYCRWAVEQTGAAVRMRTQQEFEGFQVELERTVSLTNRTVRSATNVKNSG